MHSPDLGGAAALSDMGVKEQQRQEEAPRRDCVAFSAFLSPCIRLHLVLVRPFCVLILPARGLCVKFLLRLRPPSRGVSVSAIWRIACESAGVVEEEVAR